VSKLAAAWCGALIALALVAGPGRAAEIAESAVWSGAVTVSELVTVRAAGRLTVAPGAVVRFTGEGRLDCSGVFEAEGARFESDGELAGEARFHFRPTRGRLVRFDDCVLRDLITVKRRYHDAFFSVWYAQFAMRNCLIENTSTLEILHTTDALFSGNRVVGNVHRSVMLIACERARAWDNHFEPSTFRRSTMLLLLSSQNCRIMRNRFFGFGHNVGLGLGARCSGNHAVANSFFECAIGISLDGADIRDNLFLGELILRPKRLGIAAAGCQEGNVFRNCVAWGAGSAGLEVKCAGRLSVRNCVFGANRQGVLLGEEGAAPELKHNCFWQSPNDAKLGTPEQLHADGNISQDPMFVDPDGGNFRLRTVAFGHPCDSPLVGAGTPAGVSIGLFPGAVGPTKK